MEKRQIFIHQAAIDGVRPLKTRDMEVCEIINELNSRKKSTQTKKVRARIQILKSALERKNLNNILEFKICQ